MAGFQFSMKIDHNKIQFLPKFQATAPGHLHEGRRPGRDGIPAPVHLPGRGGHTKHGSRATHRDLEGTRNRRTERGQKREGDGGGGDWRQKV